MSTNAYNPDGTLNTCTYGNGAVTQTVYDGFKRVTGVLYNGERQFTTEYAANGDGDERLLWRIYANRRPSEAGNDASDSKQRDHAELWVPGAPDRPHAEPRVRQRV